MQIKHIICSTYVFACFNYVALVMYDSLRPYGLQPARLLWQWDSLGKNTGVGCHFLLQGIFLMQGSSLCLLCLMYWQVDSLPTEPPGKPKCMCIYRNTHIYTIHFLLVVILNGTSGYQTLSLTSFSNFPFSYEVQKNVKCDCPGEIKMGLFTCYHTLFSK